MNPVYISDHEPENILYKKGKNGGLIFKISDFGLSKDVTSLIKKSLTTGLGSVEYLSPQQFKLGDYTNKTVKVEVLVVKQDKQVLASFTHVKHIVSLHGLHWLFKDYA